jgi:hypothetical protein
VTKRLLLGWFLVAALAACRRHAPVVPEAPHAEVQVQGKVWRAHAGGLAEPISGGTLIVGELLSTGPDGTATVRLAGGRQIELGPNSRLRLRAGPDRRLTIDLESGLVTSRTAESSTAMELDILTPFGITHVPPAAGQVSLSVGQAGARIAVALGSITFVDQAGRQITAHANETVVVSLGKVELVHDEPPVASLVGQPMEVMLAADEGSLLVRRPGEPRASPRRATPAPAGTQFQVAAGGSARLMTAGVRGRLGAGSAGQVGEASRGRTGLRLGLGLQRGTALLSFDGSGQDELLLGDPAAPIIVKIAEPTTISVVAGRRGPRLMVLAGAAEVLAGDSHQHLDPAMLVEVAGGQLRALARPQSDVILPTQRGLRVYTDGLQEVTLSWPSSLGEARVEVSDDPEFKDLSIAGRTAAGSVTVQAPSSGDLYWRVTGHGSTGDRVLLGQARFARDRRRSVLDLERPQNLVTEAGPVTKVYFQSALPALTFVFAGRPGAVRYRLRLYRDGDIVSPLVDRMVNDTRSAVDVTPLGEGRYLWHAVGIDRQGRDIGGGRMNKLELVYDNALTTLAIGSPRPGAPVNGPRVDATGVAPLGSKLYINGQPAALDAKGRFAVSLERASALVFRLVGPNGNERYWVRKLRVRS